MFPYLKLFTEARNDAKLRTLTDVQFRHWFNLLCYASEQEETRGTIKHTSKYQVAAEVCNGDLDALLLICNALYDLRIVTWHYCDEDDIEISFINFEKRQKRRCPEDPEAIRLRVAKHREKKRSGDVTGVTVAKPIQNGGNAHIDVELDGELIYSPCVPLTGKNGEKTHTHVRSGDDLKLVQQAIVLLGSDIRTEALGLELGRQHTSAACVTLHGWRWLKAAERIIAPEISGSRRRSFPYLAKIAANLSDADRHEKPPAPKETTAERQRREFKAAIERIKRNESLNDKEVPDGGD